MEDELTNEDRMVTCIVSGVSSFALFTWIVTKNEYVINDIAKKHPMFAPYLTIGITLGMILWFIVVGHVLRYIILWLKKKKQRGITSIAEYDDEEKEIENVNQWKFEEE